MRKEDKSTGTRENRRICNPNGIESSSPGLPQRGYPGKTLEESHNPDGVVANVTCEPDENGIVTTALRLMIRWPVDPR